MGRPEKGIGDTRHRGTKAPWPNQLGELQVQTGTQRAEGEGEEMEDVGAEGGRARGRRCRGGGKGS